VFAAKGAMKTAQKLMVKYEDAKDAYAKKAAVADAAMALDKTNQMTVDTILPMNVKIKNALKQKNNNTITQLRELYAASTHGLMSDQRYLDRVDNKAESLGESLDKAKAETKKASYERKYAAQLHETLLQKKLLHMKKQQASAERKVKREKQESKMYKREEDAVEAKEAAIEAADPDTVVSSLGVKSLLKKVKQKARRSQALAMKSADSLRKMQDHLARKAHGTTVSAAKKYLKAHPAAVDKTAVAELKAVKRSLHKSKIIGKKVVERLVKDASSSEHKATQKINVSKKSLDSSPDNAKALLELKASLLGDAAEDDLSAPKAAPPSEAEKLAKLKTQLLKSATPAASGDQAAELAKLKAAILDEAPKFSGA